jgi:hypothetical protein
MPATRRRRIVRRAVMALAVAVLLLGWYVASYLTWRWATHDMPASKFVAINRWVYPLWIPIAAYEGSDLPLSVEFLTLDLWLQSGGRSTWSESRDRATLMRRVQQLLDSGRPSKASANPGGRP